MPRDREGFVEQLPTLRAALIQGEWSTREVLREVLGGRREIRVIAEATTLEGARAILERDRPDVVFSSTVVDQKSVIDWLLSYAGEVGMPDFVFVTDADRDAVRAYELGAIDCLKRPLSKERLDLTLGRVCRMRGASSREEDRAVPRGRRIGFRADGVSHLIEEAEIVAITSFGGNYTSVTTRSGESHVVRRTFKQWEDLLDHEKFARIHRTTIINLSEVTRILPADGNSRKSVVLRSYPSPLIVSRRCTLKVKRMLERALEDQYLEG